MNDEGEDDNEETEIDENDSIIQFLLWVLERHKRLN